MIPLRDNIPSRSTPVMNYLMIALCTGAFLLQVMQEKAGVSLVDRYGMIPARVTHPDEVIVVPEKVLVQTPFGVQVQVAQRQLPPAGVAPWLTVLTCIFLHGSLMHYVGNMWFLYIFGDNVEDRLGHFGYVLFYLVSGVAASLVHLATNVDSPVPTIGASGAIAGVMGAYFCMYPKATVLSIIPIFIIMEMVVLPAPVFLGIWFAMQIWNGVSTQSGAAGVAWWAHIGGFVAGMVVAKVLDLTHHLRPPVLARRPGTEHIGMHRLGPGEHLFRD
jgi:membrane associated rhomboid family serine protease